MSDFDRPLNTRGERDGPIMSRWLSRQEYPAQWIWTSDACRTQATAEFVRAGFSLTADQLVQVRELYLADPETMLDVIRRTPAGIDSVAVVAHNPGTTYLLNLLAQAPVTDNVPTFGVARLDVPCAWHALNAGSCTVDLIVSPKTLS